MIVKFKLSDNRQEAIRELIEYHRAHKLHRYKKLMKYYLGKHIILDKVVPPNTPNNRIVTPYPKFIVDTVQGYFLGQPVQYESKDNTLKSLLDSVFDENDEDDINVEIEKTLSIMGEAFELVYIAEDSSIQFAKLDNMETIVHYNTDLKPKIDIALRYYSNDVDTFVDVYTEDKIEHYIESSGGFDLLDEEYHIFGEVPVIHYFNNKETTGDFEPAITLIDDYDRTLSNNSNEFEYFRNAYLIIKGYAGATDEEIEDAVAKRAFKVDADGDIKFLTKEINDTAVMNHLKELHDNIHFACNIPSLTDENFASNSSGVALKYKLWGFENLISAKERKFTQALTQRLKLIVEAMNIKGHNFDFKDIKLRYTRNLPENLLELSEIFKNLSGIIPAEYLLMLLPFVDDKEGLTKRLEEQNQELRNITNTNL